MWTYTVNLVRDLSPNVKRFIATESLFGIGVGISSLILNLHLLDLGFSKGDIGKITSLGALTIGLASLPAGFIVKLIGRKTMLVIGMLLAFLALVLFGIGTSIVAVTVAQLVYSLGVTAIVNSEIQLIFQYCRTKKKKQVPTRSCSRYLRYLPGSARGLVVICPNGCPDIQRCTNMPSSWLADA